MSMVFLRLSRQGFQLFRFIFLGKLVLHTPGCLRCRLVCRSAGGAELRLVLCWALSACSLSRRLPCRLPASLHPVPASREWLSDSCSGPRVLVRRDFQAPVCSWARGEDSSRQGPFHALRWPQTRSEPGDLAFCGWIPRCLPLWWPAWPAWLAVPW